MLLYKNKQTNRHQDKLNMCVDDSVSYHGMYEFVM